jgi:hypothetical protein
VLLMLLLLQVGVRGRRAAGGSTATLGQTQGRQGVNSGIVTTATAAAAAAAAGAVGVGNGACAGGRRAS